MARTALLYAAAAAVLAGAWLGLEDTRALFGKAAWVSVLALAAATAPGLARRAAAVAVATLLALAAAFGSPLSAPGRLWGGALEFWDVSLPFTAPEHARMAGAVLIGLFAFELAVALALVMRRPLAAALFTLAGAAWPATLLDAGIARGAPVLAVVLLLLAAGGVRRPLGLRGALVAGAVLVVAGLAGASSSAVAKGEFLQWKSWDPYDQPDEPVSVDFVWNADYGGIDFPDKATTVLTVEGVRRPLYWRATTLETYDGVRWIEELRLLAFGRGTVDALTDELLPPRARNPRRWVRATVTVRALRESRLTAPSTPVRYAAPRLPFLQVFEGGVARTVSPLRRDAKYTVLSYAPRPSPAQLAAARPVRAGSPATRFLEIVPGSEAPPWGAAGRSRAVRRLLDGLGPNGPLTPYQPFYREAERIAGGRQTPYAAAVALEAWLRSNGGFRYDEQPRVAFGLPPLVGFVTRAREGYCQQFAGTMALMLRMLGIPARIAAGFTNGSFDERDGPRWTVTDLDAHAWVEVWFDGWGWLPFDPTPGRGQLGGSYSTASAAPDVPAIEKAIRGDGGPSIGPAFRIGPAPSADVRGGGRSLGARAGLVGLLLGVFAGGVALLAAAKLVRRRLRYVRGDARRTAAACRAELADFLADQGVGLPASATAVELAGIVRSELGVDASRFAATLAAARFGRPREAVAAARRARRELKGLLGRLRGELTRTERFRGLVSLRSLGLSG